MAIDILVVEDEYTERQELTQLLETVTPPSIFAAPPRAAPPLRPSASCVRI